MKNKHIIFLVILLLISILVLNIIDVLKNIMRDRSNQRGLESKMVYDGAIPYIVFDSKDEMCLVFSQSYQQTINKIYDDKPDQKTWDKTIDVMNAIDDLCRIDLTDTALHSYKNAIIEKYQR